MFKIRLGRFYRVKNINKKPSANKHYNMIVVDNEQGDVEELLFTDADLLRAILRRRRNKEDIPKYAIISDNGGFAYTIGLMLAAMSGGFLGYFVRLMQMF